MGRHTGFLLCLAMLSTVVAGQFRAALTSVDPGATSPRRPGFRSVSEVGQPNGEVPVARNSFRSRTIHVAANSLVVITSLDTSGNPHTFHLRSQRAESAEGCPTVAPIQDESDLAGKRYESRPVDVLQSTQRRPRPEISTDSHFEMASLDHQSRPRSAVHRRFIAPRYGRQGVSDVMVAASLLAENLNVAIYLDQTLPDELQDQLRPGLSVLSPGLISQLVSAVAEHLGPIHDLDHDGRLCVLVTELDCQSDDQSVPVLGCVRPSDFIRTRSNEAEGTDVVYLDHRLPTGNDLIALLSHELAHASIYCRLYDRDLNRQLPLELPDWLHEGIAHYVERQFADESSVYLERRSQFYQTPHRFPVCSSPFVSSRSDRRGGSRAAVARFLQFGFRGEEPLRRALMEANDLETLLASCLQDDLADLLPAWSLLEAGEIYRTASMLIPELNVDRSITLEMLGTAFTVLRSGQYPTTIEVSCEDDSEWTASTLGIPKSTQCTELHVTRSVE